MPARSRATSDRDGQTPYWSVRGQFAPAPYKAMEEGAAGPLAAKRGYSATLLISANQLGLRKDVAFHRRFQVFLGRLA